MYFEFDLPEYAPDYINSSMAGLFEDYVKAVRTRMEKLEDALTISGLDGATFSKYARIPTCTRDLAIRYRAELIAIFLIFD